MAFAGVISPLQCAGLNRLEVEDESSLRERSSDPLGLESCAATVRDPAKRRQRIGGVGIQLRKDAIRTPTVIIPYCASLVVRLSLWGAGHPEPVSVCRYQSWNYRHVGKSQRGQ